MKYPEDFTNKVICGKDIEIMSKIPDKAINLIITSPPYNLGGDFHTMINGKRVNYGAYGEYKDNLDEPDYQEWQLNFLNECFRVLKLDGNMFYNHKNRLAGFTCISPLKWILKSKLLLRQEIIWDNTNEINHDRRRFIPCHEKIFWLSKTTTHLMNKRSLQDCWVFRNKLRRVETKHPATMARQIVFNLIECLEERPQIVLDPYSGSGTTLLVCKELGLDYIGIDINKEYVKNSQKRLKTEYLF